MAVASSNERMIAGVAAAAVSLGVAQLVGIPFGARADARAAIGSDVVDLTPGPIKEWAIQTLGSLDKLFVAFVVLVVIATIAAIAGTLETQRRPLGSAMIAAAGVLGCIAVLSRQGATALDTIPTVAGAACGVAALRLLTRRFWPGPGDPEDRADHDEPDAGRRRLVMFGLLGFGIVSGVLGAVITRLVHVTPVTPTPGFVALNPTNGNLMLNGVPWRFGGGNCYSLANQDGGAVQPKSYILTTIQQMHTLNMNCVRLHGPFESVGYPNSIQPSLGVFNSNAFANVDYILQQLNVYGIKCIATLLDWWNYAPWGGIPTYIRWRGSSTTSDFFTNPTIINDLKLHISTVLNHVNQYTGIAYKNDPAIMCWETGNELAYGWNISDPKWPGTNYGAPGGWLDQISTYIKQTCGAQQLVMDGYYGVYNAGVVDTPRLALPNVDIYTEHTYDGARNPTEIPVEAGICASHGKAYVLGEYPWNPPSQYGLPWTLAQMLTAVENSHAAGDCFWTFAQGSSGMASTQSPQAGQFQTHNTTMSSRITAY